MDDRTRPLAGFDQQHAPDPVCRPIVSWDDGLLLIDYLSRSGRWVRAAFDRLDSHRVCRGEHQPYPTEVPGPDHEPVRVVRPSSWLAERHACEARFYSDSYSFNGDVDEMLGEFEHYIFAFHDEYVEVIAGGVHFELHDTLPTGSDLLQRPGWGPLSEAAPSEDFAFHGIRYRLRTSELEPGQLIQESHLCEQVAVELALELDGRWSPSHRLGVRTRDGETKSRWRGYFGAVVDEYDGVLPVSSVLPLAEQHAGEVAARRKAMGRD